jgi:hypothetical protein
MSPLMISGITASLGVDRPFVLSDHDLGRRLPPL